MVQNTSYKIFSCKNTKYFFKLKNKFLKNQKKIYFWHNLKTDKDISEIPTDSDSAGQQLKGRTFLNKSVEKKKKNCVYSTKTSTKF